MLKRRKIWVPEPNVAELVSDQFDASLVSPSQVLVRNHYSYISAGTELACLAGSESFFTIPDTPGYTAVGEIMKKGSAVEHLKEGDLVYTYGPHAEYFIIDVEDRWHGICVKLPEGLDPALASFTHMAGIAMTSLRNSKVELGDHVLVTGQGAIGILAAQLIRLQGGDVIASDVVDRRLEIARECGITSTVNPFKTNLKAFVEERTGGTLVSSYIDASGQASVVEQSLDLLALNGEVILLGSPRAPYETNLSDHLKHFHNLPWCQTMKGALEFSYPTHECEFVKHSIERNSRIILDLILKEKLLVKPLYSHKISPAEIQRAYKGLRERPEEYIGVVIDWS